MNILVIETGGTIGSKIKNCIISPASPAQNIFKNLFKEHNFTFVSPYNILSENINYNHLEKLVEVISQNKLKNFDGIILLHGSDTLAFTSAFLGIYFKNTQIPLVITAANKPLEDKQSNGTKNFLAALKLIQDGLTGVFTVYQNTKNEMEVFLAEDIRSADIFSDDFLSNIGPLAIIENNSIIYKNKEVLTYYKNNFKYPLPNKISLKNKILLITPYPNIDYNSFNIDAFAAVLHSTYHSSTAPITPKENSVISLIDRLKAQNKKLYLSPIKQADNESLYESTNEILKNGGISMGDVSVEYALAKLIIEYNLERNSYVLQ